LHIGFWSENLIEKKHFEDLEADGWIKDNASYRNVIRGLGMDLSGSG
jgi:hypothetical protein